MSGVDGSTAAVIAETMALVSHLPADRVKVTGQGLLARQLRERGLDGETGQPPLAVVETTGLGPELTEACGVVADRGLVVLAAPASEQVDIDLYRDVHRRGLVLVGVWGQDDASKAEPRPLGNESLASRE
jgi:hypothetical protein